MVFTLPYALIENGQVVANSHPQLRVPWWSFGKTLIAAAVLREPDLDLDCPEIEGLSLRHLLGNRSGLADYGPVKAYHAAVARRDAPWTFDEVRTRAKGLAPQWPPGSDWSYSNIGYGLVVRWLEARHQCDLAEILRRGVLAMAPDAHPDLALCPADLVGVEMGADQGYHPGWVYHRLLTGPLSAAGLALDGLMEGGLLPRGALSDPDDIWPLPQHNRPPWGHAAYGLGVMAPDLASGQQVIGHTGGGPDSQIAVYWRPGRTVVTFGTGTDGDRVESEAALWLEA